MYFKEKKKKPPGGFQVELTNNNIKNRNLFKWHNNPLYKVLVFSVDDPYMIHKKFKFSYLLRISANVISYRKNLTGNHH